MSSFSCIAWDNCAEICSTRASARFNLAGEAPVSWPYEVLRSFPLTFVSSLRSSNASTALRRALLEYSNFTSKFRIFARESCAISLILRSKASFRAFIPLTDTRINSDSLAVDPFAPPPVPIFSSRLRTVRCNSSISLFLDSISTSRDCIIICLKSTSPCKASSWRLNEHIKQ